VNVRLIMSIDNLEDLEAFIAQARKMGAKGDAEVEVESYELVISFFPEGN